MELLNYLFCDMFVSVLECYELTHIRWSPSPPDPTMGCLIMFSHSVTTVGNHRQENSAKNSQGKKKGKKTANIYEKRSLQRNKITDK